MADDVEVNSGTGVPVATDDCGGKHVQVMKIAYGADGNRTQVPADAGGLLVNLGANNDVTVTGTVIATGPLTDVQIRATPLPVSGTVAVSAVSGTVAVTQSGTWDEIGINDSGNSITVDGSVTANAGTNLNTSLLALEAGGNLAGAATSLALLDDAAYAEDVAAQAADKGLSVLAVRRDTASTMVNSDNDYTNLIVDASGRLHVNVGTAAIASIAAGNNNIGDVDVASIAAGNNNIGDVDIASIAAGTNNIGDVDVLTVPTDPFGANADAASLTTSISAKLKGIATALGITALDLGTGTGGSRTLRSFQDTAQWVGGTGTDSSAVQRVSLATNVALPTGTNSIGAVTQATAASLNMTEASAATSLTSLQLIDDVVYVDDTATHATGTSKGVLFMGAATPTDSAVNANDIGAVAMTVDRKLHVAVMDALPAGAAAIGKLAANSGVDIGDVDVTSISAGNNVIGQVKITDGTLIATVRDTGSTDSLNVAIVDGSGNQITSFGGGTQYTEDAAAAADPVGNALIMVRKDTLAALTTTDGDNVAARGTDKGELYVKHVDALTVSAHAVTNAGVFAVQVDGNALTSLQLIDDPVAVLGTATYTEASTKGMIAAGVRRDADTTLVDTTNEIAPFQVDARGCVKVEAFSGEVLPVSNAAGSFVVQENGSALTALQLIDDGVYTDDTSTHATGTSKGYGIMAAAAPTDTAVNANDIGMVGMTVNRELYVSLITAIPAGSAAIGKLAANSGVDIGDIDVTSIIPGTAATNLGKAEDAGHTTGDVGVMALGVRNDADASFGADLDYTPMSCDAGGNTNVRVRPSLKKINVQSGGLTTTATAYTAGDQVGNQFTFAGCARASGGGGYITGVTLKSAADTTGVFDLILLNATATLAADNAAYAITDAEALTFEAIVNLAGSYDIGANRIAVANNLRIPYKCAATSLFGGLITRSAIAATPFAAATDIDLTLYVELD